MFVLKKLRSILNKYERENSRSNTGNNITDLRPLCSIDGTENAIEAMENIILPFVDIAEHEILSEDDTDIIDDIELSVPNIYVDAKLLRQFDINSCKENRIESTIYRINGNIFWDDTNITKTNDLFEFEIKERVGDHVGVMLKELQRVQSLETDVESDKVNEDDSFPIAIEITPYGLIINSIILLTENAWNTILCGDITICIACNTGLDIREIAGHIATDKHRRTLEKFKPLKEFDINIVRKINDTYHCGICNVIFEIEDTDHVESVSHGEKVLKAVNKVSDVTDYDNDFDVSRNGNRNIDNDSINYDIAEDSSGIDMQSFDGFYDDFSVSYCSDGEDNINEQNVFSYADMAKKPKTYTIPKYVQIKLVDNYAKVTFDSWHMIIVLKTNNYYCMACKENGPIRYKSEHCLKLTHVEKLMKCNIVRDYKEHVIRKVDDKLFHCGHCNNLHMIHEIRDHIERNHIRRSANINVTENAPLSKCTAIRSTRHSPNLSNYKNIATAKPATPTHFANNETAKSPTPTHIANNETTKSPTPTHIANNGTAKSATPTHIANNDRNITININNENYDQAISNVSRNSVNQSTNISVNQTLNKAENMTVGRRNRNNKKHNPITFVPYNQVLNEIPYQYVEMESKIIIREFGQTYYVSLLAYNFIQQRRPNAYFCCICDVWCVNVRNHISDRIHATRASQAPFLPQTSFHLIRQTKYGFHCVVCDIYLQSDPILHTWENVHLSLLKNTICNPLPSIPNSQVVAPITQTMNTSEVKKVNENEQKTEGNTDNENNIAHNENLAVQATEEKDFDPEEYLYVKVKNIYTKITITSYNSLVQSGTGARYCVLCSVNVFFDDLKAHISNTDHVKNMKKCNFLKKYERHLVRQMSTRYHCALCNVWLIIGSLNDHISWPTHKEIEANKVVKHTRRNEIKMGITEIACTTQDEIVTSNTNMKNDFEILTDIEFRLTANQDIVKKKRIVKIDGVVLKISWDAFHGICKQKNGYKCIICQTDFKSFGLSAHIENSRHMQILEDGFQLEFSPALIRKVNASTLHCLTCNMEVNNKHHSISDHVGSKGHVKKFKSVVADKSDCDIDRNDVLTLTRSDCKKC